ncbi:ABC transporter permease [Acrocarpospora macrocephala]|uniref:ABC transporter permease n=1 Tax=Acrocarpospora macrocephala TaxID=150177 RepID=UPI0012D332D0|nr:ABC transporter permease [Acrocarpospora macrocephala]
MNWVNAIVQGVLLGGLYALFACGLSLMFGVMRIISLAHGDLAVAAAYIVVALGPAPWSFVIVIPLFGVLGYLLQRSLIQASIDRGPLTTLLVTFGLSVVIANLLLEVFTADSHSFDTGAFASGSVEIVDGLSVGYLSIAVFVAAVAVLVGLQLFMSRSGTGRLIRAVADDPEAARLSGVGHRHVFGIAAAIAFATVALAGLAFGMYSSFAPSSGTSRLLFAFEAVVIGGLGSLWGTLLGGVVLGLSQAIGAQINLSYAVIAGHLVFLAVLALRPQGLTGAGAPRAWFSPLRRARRFLDVRRAVSALPRPLSSGGGPREGAARPSITAVTVVVVGVAGLACLPYVVFSGTTDTLVNLFILLTMASAWNLLAGYGGLVSVGQQAFVGLGAYFVLMLAQRGADPFAAIPLAVIGCGAVALVFSWLVFRLRGGYFAIATWVVADVCQLVISRFPALGGGTGASVPGLAGIDPALLGAMTYWAALAVAVLTVGGIFLALRTRLGLALTAIRDDETGARSLGVGVARTQRIVYVLAAFGCGAAGALLAVSQLNVEPTSAFAVQWTAQMIFVTVIGGLGSVEGPIVGTALYFVLQQALAGYGAWYLIILGLLATGVAIWAPRGLWGLVAHRRAASLT